MTVGHDWMPTYWWLQLATAIFLFTIQPRPTVSASWTNSLSALTAWQFFKKAVGTLTEIASILKLLRKATLAR
ncbi:hypothetical protein [uncultured Fructobacillus sp.]|uniref:hypothetical protein n=1 Tax=uncultured Fructobacillus sp. TaxID=591942 RepID=UPI002598C14A|nr:hypothetical protein [uncultured Fructobacillus sp.]